VPRRGIEMMLGVLATLKAGGAYVAGGSAYPSERRSTCCETVAVCCCMRFSRQKCHDDCRRSRTAGLVRWWDECVGWRSG